MSLSADKIQSIVVVGAGVMGEGIAQSFAEAGLTVHIFDLSPEALARCETQIRANLELGAQHGVTAEPVDTIMARIRTATGDELPGLVQVCDMALETAPEVLEIKKSIFAQLDKAPPHALLATNASSFTVSQITEGMETAHRVIGLHYFNPAHLIPAVEVHKGETTSQEMIDLAMELMRHVGKIPVLVRKEIPGFIINRLTGALSREIDHLLDEGVVLPEDLDAAIKASLGFRLAQLGPMEAKDFIGLDTDARVSKMIYPMLSDREDISEFGKEKVTKGDFGVKTGRGVFDYSGRTRADVLRERNVKLLKQRRLFIESQKDSSS